LNRTRRRPKPKVKHRKALALTLNRAPFDAIVAGEKKTEYRDNKAYWRSRLIGIRYEEVHFRNGYSAKAPFLRVEYRGLWKYGKGRGSTFGIRLGRILELRHYKKRRSV
jgi:hypothetical protein